LRSLEAIEQDEVTSISSAFLYRSFVRQVATFLGIDYAEIEPGVNSLVGRMPALLVPGEGGPPAPKVAALRMGRKRSSKLIYSLSSFAAVLIGCTIFYGFLESSKFNLPRAFDNLTGSSVDTTPAAPKPGPAPSAAPGPTSPSTSENLPAKGNGFTLELSATEPAWLSIIADGKKSFDGILQRAQTKILEGRRTARVETANAGGVEAVFNGRSLGVLGPHGQTRTVLFTKNRYEVLNEPRHVAAVGLNQSAGLRPPLPPFQLLPASRESMDRASLAADGASDAPMQ
jgi:hypothetical protein